MSHPFSSLTKKERAIAIIVACVVFLLGVFGAKHLVPTQEPTPAPAQSSQDQHVVESEQTADAEALSIQWISSTGTSLTASELPEAFVQLIFSYYARMNMSDENTSDEKEVTERMQQFETSRADFAFQAFPLGTVSGGTYADATLFMGQWMDQWGIGEMTYHFYYLTDAHGKLVLLDKVSVVMDRWGGTSPRIVALFGQDVMETFQKTGTVEMFVRVPELEAPPILFDAKGRTFSLKTIARRGETYSSATTFSAFALGSSRQYSLVASDERMFSFTRPDGFIAEYTYDIPFLPLLVDGYTGEVKWEDGTILPLNQYKTIVSTGCGYASPDVVPVDQLGLIAPAGTVFGADQKSYEIFKPVWSPEDVERAEDSEEPYTAPQSLYQNYRQRLSWLGENQPPATFEGFLETHPVFLWQDPFGRWLRFTHESSQSAAECGKPVIYLYPTSTTDMTVHVAPKGGFSFTEPTYNNGWRVTAHPDGTLVNKDDGKTYPYLFWEGKGNEYEAPEQFWVVAKENVPTFITQTLAQIGLNEKEIADFTEFWLPRMTAAPYYQIGFHGTRAMDVIAPLTLSQSPETILRILMDYKELDAPIPENPPRLPPTLVRRGFTVIEWGGVLR